MIFFSIMSDMPDVNFPILDLGSSTINGAYLDNLIKHPSILLNTHPTFPKVNKLNYLASLISKRQNYQEIHS